jgi:NitT/TauT family transport system ATP-binding protein
MKNAIIAKDLKKIYNEREVISNLSFSIKNGEFVAIFGPNGCGKSTLLNMLAGLSEKTSGEIEVSEFSSNTFSYIFQNYRESLLLWKNNYENVVFPLKISKVKEDEIKVRLMEMESIFNFSPNFNLFPYQLSGGQQQIVAFMRALITKPKLLFIDEPFSALDYENNLLLRKHLQNYYTKYKPTVLVITHDIEEAVHLANKIIVLSKQPTKIVEIIKNNAPYPRGTNFLNSKQFAQTKEKVLKAFQAGATQ